MNKITGLIQNWIETKATQKEMRFVKNLLDAKVKPVMSLKGMDDVKQFAIDGQKLLACKLYKDLVGCDLKMAKDAIDKMYDEYVAAKNNSYMQSQALGVAGIQSPLSTFQQTTNLNAAVKAMSSTQALSSDPYPHLTSLSEQYKLMQR